MRINEWNEELVEMFEAWVVLRASEGANVDDLRYIVTIARAQHQAANDLRAQLAQRDAELAALRHKLWAMFTLAESEKDEIDRYPSDDSSAETVVELYGLLAAAITEDHIGVFPREQEAR